MAQRVKVRRIEHPAQERLFEHQFINGLHQLGGKPLAPPHEHAPAFEQGRPRRRVIGFGKILDQQFVRQAQGHADHAQKAIHVAGVVVARLVGLHHMHPVALAQPRDHARRKLGGRARGVRALGAERPKLILLGDKNRQTGRHPRRHQGGLLILGQVSQTSQNRRKNRNAALLARPPGSKDMQHLGPPVFIESIDGVDRRHAASLPDMILQRLAALAKQDSVLDLLVGRAAHRTAEPFGFDQLNAAPERTPGLISPGGNGDHFAIFDDL